MATYYVKNGGDNEKSGADATNAWETLQYAANRAAPGDIIRVLAGEYERFDIDSGGTAGGGVITFQADDPDDRPYIRTAYYNIADTAFGSTARGAAAIYVTAGRITLDGFQFTNERAIAIAFVCGGEDTYNFTIKNCRFYDVRAVRNLSMTNPDTDGANATGPVWISHSGHGYQNYNFTLQDCVFDSCWARRPIDGRGTEICTINGAHNGVLIDGNYFVDCYGINLNMLGVNSTDNPNRNVLGQPRNIVIRNNTFVDAYRTNDGDPAPVNSMYFDRGTGPAEVYGNLFYNPSTQASPKLSFEQLDRLAGIVPTRRIVFRDNVVVVGQLGLIIGSGDDADINKGKILYTEDIGIAHNVLITANNPADIAPFRLSHCKNVSVKNNVIASYGGQNLIDSNSVQTASDIASFVAEGNIAWTSKTTNSVEWGLNRNMTAAAFNSNIQGGTGWTTKPAFANGVTAIPMNADLTSYTLADWTLAAASPGYKAAVPLAYTENNGTSKTEIQLTDVRFFAPGIPALGVTGTAILVGGTAATVTAVNHETRTITVSSAISWQANDPVRYSPITAGVYSVGITSAASEDSEIPDGGDQGGGDQSGGVNLLANASFDDGDAVWTFSAGDGAGSFATAGGAATVTVTTGSVTTQLYQFDVPIVSGTDYILSVFGKVDSAPQDVTVKVISHTTFVSFGLNSTITLGSDCAEHRVSFTSTGTTSNARVQFVFPSAATYTIYGVYFGTSVSIDTMCPPPVLGGGDPIDQTIQVATSLDDWGDNSGTFFGTTTEILAGGGDKDSSRYDYRYLARFQIAETIDVSAVVELATLEVYKAGSDSGAGIPNMRVRAVASTNTTQPASSAASKALSLTTAYVDYVLPDTSQQWRTITGLEPIIEELLALGELTAGNYVTLVIEAADTGWGGSNTMQYMRTYDYTDGSYAAKLRIVSAPPAVSAAASIAATGGVTPSSFMRAHASASIGGGASLSTVAGTITNYVSATMAAVFSFSLANLRGPVKRSATIVAASALSAAPSMVYAASAQIAAEGTISRSTIPDHHASATIAAQSGVVANVYYAIAMGGEGAIAHYRTAGATSTRSTDREKRSGVATKRYRP